MDKYLLQKLRRMDEKQLYAEVYGDALTGVLNRRAYEVQDSQFVAIIDLDSLKYVNDTLGHRAGDFMICKLASALAETFGAGSVYRLGGDEFAVRSEKPMHLRYRLAYLRGGAQEFSFGVGRTLIEADKCLTAEKFRRERTKERASRGARPPWFSGLEDQIKCLFY